MAPKVVLYEMIKIQRDFLLGGNRDGRAICWVAWDGICAPKKEGGLGIKNLHLFNIALLSKWKWRYLCDYKSYWRDLLTFQPVWKSGALSHKTGW